MHRKKKAMQRKPPSQQTYEIIFIFIFLCKPIELLVSESKVNSSFGKMAIVKSSCEVTFKRADKIPFKSSQDVPYLIFRLKIFTNHLCEFICDE